MSECLGRPLHAYESAVCGCFAGGVAAGATTPLDVLKTRTILYEGSAVPSMFALATKIAKEEGIIRLFSGVIPRVTWITIGGGIFFGAYEKSKQLLSDTNI